MSQIIKFLKRQESRFRSIGYLYLLHQYILRLPREVSVELTNNCNLKCAKCPTYETGRVRGFLDFNVYQKLLKDIDAAPWGSTNIVFTGSGEATLHEDFIKYVRMAKAAKRVKAVRVVTNALDLTADLVNGLVAAKVDSLNVSLDTLNREMYLKYNRVDGLDRVIDNIEYLVASHGEMKINLKVTLYKNDQVLIDEIKKRFEDRFDTIRFSGLHNWLGLRGKQKNFDKKPRCNYPFYQIQVLWDGQITLCCHDCMEGKINMGNIKNVMIGKYWLSRGVTKSRLDQISGNVQDWSVCVDCDAYLYDFEKKL